MSLIAAAVRLSEEAPVEHSGIPAWGIGLVGFGVLVALLVVTVMLKVERLTLFLCRRTAASA